MTGQVNITVGIWDAQHNWDEAQQSRLEDSLYDWDMCNNDTAGTF